MPTKKLVVSTYTQYVFIVVGALLLLTFVRQLGGVLFTFLLAGVLAYALNPLIRRLEAVGVPTVVAVLGVFLGLTVTVLLAALVLIIPAVGQVRNLVRDPTGVHPPVGALRDPRGHRPLRHNRRRLRRPHRRHNLRGLALPPGDASLQTLGQGPGPRDPRRSGARRRDPERRPGRRVARGPTGSGGQ